MLASSHAPSFPRCERCRVNNGLRDQPLLCEWSAGGSYVSRAGGNWAVRTKIPPNNAKTFSYYGGVALRCPGYQLTYTRVDQPTDYVSAGLSSVGFKAQLASDLKIYLLPTSV